MALRSLLATHFLEAANFILEERQTFPCVATLYMRAHLLGVRTGAVPLKNSLSNPSKQDHIRTSEKEEFLPWLGPLTYTSLSLGSLSFPFPFLCQVSFKYFPLITHFLHLPDRRNAFPSVSALV